MSNPKPEYRNPKEIRSARNPNTEVGCREIHPAAIANSDFGPRISGFLRVSVFGFRISSLHRRRPQAPHIGQAAQEDFVLPERRAGVEAVAHFSAE